MSISSLTKIDKIFATPNFFVADESIPYELIRDICLYISHNVQTDLFGSYTFDYTHFAKSMGYSAANLRTSLPKEVALSDDEFINRAFNTVIGHALLSFTRNNIQLVTNSSDSNRWKSSTEVEGLQVIRKVIAYRSFHNKVIFQYDLTDTFIENLHLNFFKIDLPYYASLKGAKKQSSGLQDLYLYLMNIRNREAANLSAKNDLRKDFSFSSVTFNYLKNKVKANYSDESKNKSKIKKCFDLLFDKTGATIDFSRSPDKSYSYEPIIHFLNINKDTVESNNDFREFSKHRELFMTMVNRKLWEFVCKGIDYDSLDDKNKKRAYDRFLNWKRDKKKSYDFKSDVFAACYNKYMVLSDKYEIISKDHPKAVFFAETGSFVFK